MGEIADMMIGGDLCEGCGSALSGEGYGIPRYCSNECASDRGYDGVSSDGSGYYKDKKKSREPSINRNFSVKIHYNGELMLSVKEVVDNDPETKQEVINLIKMLYEALGEVSEYGKVGGSILNLIDKKES